jgi:hypothetical protein
MKIGEEIGLNELQIGVINLIVAEKLREKGSASEALVYNSEPEGVRWFRGIAAEHAFCAALNLMPVIELSGAKPFDCRLRSGLKVDVKATRYNGVGAGLLIPRKDKDLLHRPDIYAQMLQITDNCYRFMGCVSTRRALQDRWLKDLGRGPGLVIPHEELHELEEVESWLLGPGLPRSARW